MTELFQVVEPLIVYLSENYALTSEEIAYIASAISVFLVVVVVTFICCCTCKLLEMFLVLGGARKC